MKNTNEPHAKIEKNPPVVKNYRGNINRTKKCGAKTRRGTACMALAMKNGRCRMHGGKSTGPRTPKGLARSRKANWKHGYFAKEAVEERRLLKRFTTDCRNFLQKVPRRGFDGKKQKLIVSDSLKSDTH